MTSTEKRVTITPVWDHYTALAKPDIVSLREFNLCRSGELDIHDQAEMRKRKNILDLIWASPSDSDPRHLISSDSNGELSLVDLAKNQAIHTEKICSTWLYCIAMDPFAGKVIAAGSLNSKIFINKVNWNKSEKIKLNTSLIGHRGAIRCAKFLSESV